MTAWEYYISQRVPGYILANPGKLKPPPAVKRGPSEPYHGPSMRTKAKRAAKRARRSK